ncbi:MAG: uroporphyrinogen-III C-methyltransferase [Salinarimonadaceae bacterium]|nr:MAG: uroporphyrinogen-III C-methyltransferase [Salinarimonadaceae bacterium]
MTRHVSPRHILPQATRPARLAPLPKLPLFLDLAGRRAVLVGDGDPVAWKAELVAAAGALVTVYAPDPGPELLALAASGAGVAITRRAWRPDDIDGAAIAVGDIADDAEAGDFVAAARARGALANVIDRPDFCDFQFGAIVNRAPVIVAVSTDGAAPILGQAIRQKIEAILPTRLGGWAGAAKGFREQLKALIPDAALRRRFWERFVNVAFISQAEEDARLAELERMAGDLRRDEDETRNGSVAIVGAGPGDPGLVTLEAMRALQSADVVIYDRLVTPEVLELARREARRIHVGKEGHGDSCRQEDICALSVRLAGEGKRVVRLKGGDPAVFARTAEEVAACRAAGVPCAIVPGVTTASAAAAALGVSLTDRGVARRLQFVTGHDETGALPQDLDLAALADPNATTVIYMGRRTAARLAGALIAQGLAPQTPAIVATNVSRPDASARRTDLAGLAEGAALGTDVAPTLVLIGRALAAAHEEAAPDRRAFAHP